MGMKTFLISGLLAILSSASMAGVSAAPEGIELCGRVNNFIVYKDKVEVIVVPDWKEATGNQGWEFKKKEGFTPESVEIAALKAMELPQKATFCVPNVLNGRKTKEWYFHLNWNGELKK
jgi:hypothetical protein